MVISLPRFSRAHRLPFPCVQSGMAAEIISLPSGRKAGLAPVCGSPGVARAMFPFSAWCLRPWFEDPPELPVRIHGSPRVLQAGRRRMLRENGAGDASYAGAGAAAARGDEPAVALLGGPFTDASDDKAASIHPRQGVSPSQIHLQLTLRSALAPSTGTPSTAASAPASLRSRSPSSTSVSTTTMSSSSSTTSCWYVAVIPCH